MPYNEEEYERLRATTAIAKAEEEEKERAWLPVQWDKTLDPEVKKVRLADIMGSVKDASNVKSRAQLAEEDYLA